MIKGRNDYNGQCKYGEEAEKLYNREGEIVGYNIKENKKEIELINKLSTEYANGADFDKLLKMAITIMPLTKRGHKWTYANIQTFLYNFSTKEQKEKRKQILEKRDDKKTQTEQTKTQQTKPLPTINELMKDGIKKGEFDKDIVDRIWVSVYQKDSAISKAINDIILKGCDPLDENIIDRTADIMNKKLYGNAVTEMAKRFTSSVRETIGEYGKQKENCITVPLKKYEKRDETRGMIEGHNATLKTSADNVSILGKCFALKGINNNDRKNEYWDSLIYEIKLSQDFVLNSHGWTYKTQKRFVEILSNMVEDIEVYFNATSEEGNKEAR